MNLVLAGFIYFYDIANADKVNVINFERGVKHCICLLTTVLYMLYLKVEDIIKLSCVTELYENLNIQNMIFEIRRIL